MTTIRPRPAGTLATLAAFTLLASLPIISTPAAARAQHARIVLDRSAASAPVTGRLFLFLARTNDREPRFQAGSYGGSVPFFGVDVSALAPGQAATVDASTLGFPLESLRDVPPGDYYAQALLNVYTEFHRADGHVIWAHMDQWEGQRFDRAPGNLISDVQRVHIDRDATISLVLTRVLPPVEVPADTKWVKRIKIQSKLLSAFWGRPIYIGATVLLPKGFDEEPGRHYPAIYIQGHFGLRAPFGFDTDTAQSESPEQRAARLARTAREPGFEFAKSWMSDDFPRMVAITFQHPTPYYDDSYAVNSANNGPYADALLTELVPLLEKKFRLIPQAHARLLTGGSTGGWESIALQIHHPDFFGGTWTLYPDPVDFRDYQMTNIYEDTSAFVPNVGPATTWVVPERFMSRTPEGQSLLTMRMMSRLEAVLGSHERSGQQMNAWDAAYGPVGSDGYPKPLWDKLTGHIDKDVAMYMRDHGYDLTYYLQQNWSRIGPLLAGKIHVYVGDMDNYYLNLAVYRMEDALRSMTNPKADAVFEYGRPMKPHGWQPFTNAELVRLMDAQVKKNPGSR
ncbi:MAG TPA: alpha/beta hydrolase-fold protein [Gemmatimonadaceae bacterium]|jgi:Enterochelin esterase and related enzymes